LLVGVRLAPGLLEDPPARAGRRLRHRQRAQCAHRRPERLQVRCTRLAALEMTIDTSTVALPQRAVEVLCKLSPYQLVGQLGNADAARAARGDDLRSATRSRRDTLVGLGHCGPPGRTARIGAEALWASPALSSPGGDDRRDAAVHYSPTFCTDFS